MSSRHIPRATLRVVESSQGHDAFLLESGVMSEYISENEEDEAQEAAGEVSDGWTQAAPALSHIDVSNGEDAIASARAIAEARTLRCCDSGGPRSADRRSDREAEGGECGGEQTAGASVRAVAW